MPTVTATECARCALCAYICPASLFTWKDGAVAQFSEENAQQCIHCGHCYALCPAGAITLDGISPLQMPSVVKAPLEPVQRTMLFRTRRSVRAFKKDVVPKALLKEALLDASYAPTGGNMQNVEWLLVQDPAQLKALVSQTAEWIRASKNPRYARYVQGYDAGTDPILRGAPQAIFAHTPSSWKWGPQDATGAVSYLDLSLHSRGVSSCWTGLVIAAAATGAVPALHIPADHIVHGGLMLGYPEVQFVRVPPRKDVRVRGI